MKLVFKPDTQNALSKQEKDSLSEKITAKIDFFLDVSIPRGYESERDTRSYKYSVELSVTPLTHGIVVNVVDAKTKQNIDGATVKAVSADKKQLEEKTKDGEAKLLNLSDGEYEITVSANGYREKTAKIKLDFSEKDILSTTFSLTEDEGTVEIKPI